jgi:hypothetical protein
MVVFDLSSPSFQATPPPVNQEEDELQRAIRLSMQDHNNNPGAVSMPGLGGGGSSRSHSSRSEPPPSSHGGSHRPPSNLDVTTLMHMGFTSAQAHDALRRHNNDVQLAANYLVGGN